MSEQMATLTVEYGCTRSCQVEYDLSETNARFTYRQMLSTAEAAHLKAHEREAVKVCWPIPNVTVRAVALAEAVTR